jgi:hypothetical protein
MDRLCCVERNCESYKKVEQIPRKDRSVKHKKCEQKNKTQKCQDPEAYRTEQKVI